MSALDDVLNWSKDNAKVFDRVPETKEWMDKFILSADNELAQLRTSNQRMSDVVSAAVRAGNWLKTEVDAHKQVASCDCYECTLIRAVDKYIAEEK